jgi:hypothetical protein
MKECDALRPLLYRIDEGEATPDEAMRGARHLSRCTSCRILLARLRRMTDLLENGLTDELVVGEEFVRAVMAELPHRPPAPPRAPRKLRALKLAGLVTVALLAPHLASDLALPGAELARLDALPGFDTEPARGWPAGFAGLARVALAAAEALSGRLPHLGLGLGVGDLLPVAAAIAVAGMIACTAALALASRVASTTRSD